MDLQERFQKHGVDIENFDNLPREQQEQIYLTIFEEWAEEKNCPKIIRELVELAHEEETEDGL